MKFAPWLRFMLQIHSHFDLQRISLGYSEDTLAYLPYTLVHMQYTSE